MSNYNFGNYICELREKKGLSQSELGKILGVTNKAISKWERADGLPDANVLKKLGKLDKLDESEEIKQKVDYIVGYRQKEKGAGKASSIIKLGTGGQVKVIRE